MENGFTYESGTELMGGPEYGDKFTTDDVKEAFDVYRTQGKSYLIRYRWEWIGGIRRRKSWLYDPIMDYWDKWV